MERTPATSQPLVTLTSIIPGKSSQTLLEFLSKRFKYLSAEEWRKRILDGAVKVNGREASEGQPLRAGDEVAYTTDSWEEPEVRTDYRTLYEDDALLILSKPAPLPVHAIGAYFRNTLVQLLRRDRPDAKDFKPVHRLDSETSGLIAFVKDGKYLRELQKQFAAVGAGRRQSRAARPDVGGTVDVVGAGPRACPGVNEPFAVVGAGLRARPGGDEPPAAGSFKKTYRAIVFGKFPAGRQTLDAPIGKKVGSPVRMKLTVISQGIDDKDHGHPERSEGSMFSPSGVSPSPSRGEGGDEGAVASKPSVTKFECLEVKGNFSLVEARPLTGRTHQIRVHLEHLGFPIVGDKLYSGNDETFLHFYEHDWDDWLKERVLLPRLALHAFKLEFTHPVTGKRVSFEDPLPRDLSEFWGAL